MYLSTHSIMSLLCAVLLSVFRMLIGRVPLSRKIVYRVCICCLFLFVIFLSRDILFAVSDLVLLLLHNESHLPHPPSTAVGTCLLIYWPCIHLLSHFFFKDYPNFNFMCRMSSTFCITVLIWGKAIPLLAWTGPEGSRSLAFPDFKTIGTWRR